MIPETPQQVNAGPTNPSVFASACDDGRLLISTVTCNCLILTD